MNIVVNYVKSWEAILDWLDPTKDEIDTENQMLVEYYQHIIDSYDTMCKQKIVNSEGDLLEVVSNLVLVIENLHDTSFVDLEADIPFDDKIDILKFSVTTFISDNITAAENADEYIKSLQTFNNTRNTYLSYGGTSDVPFYEIAYIPNAEDTSYGCIKIVNTFYGDRSLMKS